MGTIRVSEDAESSALTIWVNGRFDFSTHREFRSAYKELNRNFASYVVNVSGVEYIDSSALGMLLLLREFVKSANAKLAIAGCNSDVAKIFRIANFDKLFDIS